MTKLPITNCSNCNSSHLTLQTINFVIPGGLSDMILNTTKTKKLDGLTCRDCGLVVFFDPEIYRV